VQHTELAQGIARGREESSHRIADRMLALADVAMREPAMANSCRVAADILKWQAMVRNPGAYGERTKVEATVTATSPRTPEEIMEVGRRVAHVLSLARNQPADPGVVLPHEAKPVDAEFIPVLPGTTPAPKLVAFELPPGVSVRPASNGATNSASNSVYGLPPTAKAVSKKVG
jgi:hypothetical protein